MTTRIDALIERLRPRAATLYGDRQEACLAALRQVVERYPGRLPERAPSRWSQRDVVLITYSDQVQSEGESALAAQREFLTSAGLDRLISTVHILPFCPHSSDDGFSVIDYRQVDPVVGDWQDLRDLGARVDLMFDLVLNHCSQASEWFQAYLQGKAPYTQFFIEVDPGTDLSAVTRPRSLPLLTEFETSRGTRHVWTTFSRDQVDLNFAEPDVLVAMLDVLLFYVEQGARIIRLDAIAYLWKQIGTTCIHLPKTHEVVKLMRDVLDSLAPHVLLLTETNVPHEENVSYFGHGDEAHMVYQFSLPPLLIDAMLHEDAGPLRQWLASLEQAAPGTTYLNFTASHDGIGVRPLEGLVSDERFAHLLAAVKDRGGHVSMRNNPDGSDTPYEMNITYLDALGEPGGMDSKLHARRFLTSQAIMLALRGIPAVYFHSLVGTTNDEEGVEASGKPRRINRHKFRLDELRERIAAPGSLQALVYEGYRRLLFTRAHQSAFHPDAAQEVLDLGDPALLAFLRSSTDGRQQILILANMSATPRKLHLSEFGGLEFSQDLLAAVPHDPDRPFAPDDLVAIEPFQAMWLEVTNTGARTRPFSFHRNAR